MFHDRPRIRRTCQTINFQSGIAFLVDKVIFTNLGIFGRVAAAGSLRGGFALKNTFAINADISEMPPIRPASGEWTD